MAVTTIYYREVDLPNGERVAYRERQGGEKKVLLIHGNMTSSKHWDLVLESMDKEFTLYAIDLRGFGRSSYHEKITSIRDFSDDVKQFVEAISLTDFSIVGWSAGGAVAMQFAADYPGHCQRVILLASASTRGYPFYGAGGRRLKTYEEVKEDRSKTIPMQHAYDTRNRSCLKTVWNTVIYTKYQPDEEKYEEYIDDMLTQKNLAEVYQALNIFNISEKHNGLKEGNGLAKNIMIPVLVLRGNRDLVITEEMVKETVEDLGKLAKFVELKDCGHSPLIDDLDQLLQVMTEFLNK